MDATMVSSMCRCCATEGAFKDIKSTYHWMGEPEVYADMLRDCFDITLQSSEENEDGGICEVCITQLRNAANFKKQVLHTESQFKKLVKNQLFKSTIVKLEVAADDILGSDDNNLDDDGFSGPEYDVPIKTESPEEPKPKKRAAKATTSRAKKAKIEDAESSTKRGDNIISIKKEKKPAVGKYENKISNRLDANVRNELEKHYTNIVTIQQCSNATSFRRRVGVAYLCSFCPEKFQNPADLKKHTLEGHNAAKAPLVCSNKSKKLFNYCVRLDITTLTCNLCAKNIDSLEELVDHLINVHKKHIYKDIKNHIMPFKFLSEEIKCCICLRVFEKFKNLIEHMHTHYRNYECDLCNAGFVNQECLTRHKGTHKIGSFKCSFCSKEFNTLIKKKSHERFAHTNIKGSYKCGYCEEVFKYYNAKEAHVSEVHGVKPKPQTCGACDRTFTSGKDLRMHVKKYHLMEKRHKCPHCDMAFYRSSQLDEHIVKHTGEKKYQCQLCLKSYGRLWTLKAHMRIHADDRRHKCEHCDQAFVQKCSLKGHLKSKHGVFS